MANIEIQPDCGNAPRKLFLKDLTVAFAHNNLNHIIENIPENIVWVIVGQNTITGKENYLATLRQQPIWNINKLIIDLIITHGPDASVSGKIITTENIHFSFCDIYRFKGAVGTVINSITTFLIQV